MILSTYFIFLALLVFELIRNFLIIIIYFIFSSQPVMMKASSVLENHLRVFRDCCPLEYQLYDESKFGSGEVSSSSSSSSGESLESI